MMQALYIIDGPGKEQLKFLAAYTNIGKIGEGEEEEEKEEEKEEIIKNMVGRQKVNMENDWEVNV